MSKTEILTTVAEVIKERFGHDGVLTCETVASEVDGWDSVAHVELILELEERFGIRLTTGEAANLPNVGALVAVIQKHLTA
jgi:acyl carrier protein